MKAIAIVIALGACAGSSQPVKQPDTVEQKPGAPSCLAVADRLTILKMLQQEPEPRKAELRELAVVVQERCVVDKWSDEAKKCYGAAETDTAAEGCDRTLTADQTAAIKKMLATKRDTKAAELAAMIQKMEEFADQSCLCKAGDGACAQKVSEDMSKWGAAQSEESRRIDPSTDPRFDAAIKKLTECITKAMTPVEPAPAAPAKTGPAKKKPAGK
ncbi:MAG TPA: hypothetical protein VIU61_19050 [Kofleriaceae bacterium]